MRDGMSGKDEEEQRHLNYLKRQLDLRGVKYSNYNHFRSQKCSKSHFNQKCPNHQPNNNDVSDVRLTNSVLSSVKSEFGG